MADFRRCLYALAFVALLAGLTMPASAQPFQCTNSTGVPPIVRAEGYAELVGDLVLDCTGGIPTPPNQLVPQVNIAVNLDTFVSSKITAVVGTNTEFLESLIIIDEPNSSTNPTTGIRNCGAAGEDTTVAGPGICTIVGGGSAGAAGTYNGTIGHPNVFQGRSLALITGQTNQVVFLSIPIDPPGTQCPAATAIPGTPCHRIIRITNIRGDASTTGVAQGNQTSSITAQIIVNPVSGLPIDNPSHVVARVQLGLVQTSLANGTVAGGKLDFIQCTLLQNQTQGLVFTFREAFANAFKPKTLRQTLNNGTASPYAYTGVACTGVLGANQLCVNTSGATTLNQNVPGTTYDTESGFMNPNDPTTAAGNSPTNPLSGVGAGVGVAFSDGSTGIATAGVATQGTRLALNFANIPSGVTISVPTVVQLTNVINNQVSGVAVLVTGTVASGSGGTPAPSLATPVPNVFVAGTQIPGGAGTLPQRAVYEVFFANPGALEQLAVPISVATTCALTNTPTAPCPNLPGNLPTPNSVGTVQGGFAPSYAPSLAVRTAALEGSGLGESTTSVPAVLPVPRFQNLFPPVNLLSVVRCSCNLLFPFVTNVPFGSGNIDTGIAIANTSLDPGNLPPQIYGFRATAQTGPVQLWYYNRNGTPAAEPNFLNQGNTQCTNSTTAGSCSGTLTSVPAGGMLTYVLSAGGFIAPSPTTAGPSVLLGAPGFQGYIIAQAAFQYCHGFAFISKQSAGFQADNMAMGYLAIVLDAPSTLNSLFGGLPRTFSIGENDAH
ncbi:MAG: hypothetical protein JWO19_1800 [Bryobacterales bacterium]|nr:hypothetical protein [Bryobacterales bacterium]